MEAIIGTPLDKYFDGLNQGSDSYTCFKANKYLAEDRIMCLEILIKSSQKWILSYLPGAIAKTDPPQSMGKLMQ